MDIVNKGLIAFNYAMPIYNWFFPIDYGNSNQDNDFKVFNCIDYKNISNRALYLHIPFCEDICAFCPFARSTFKDRQVIEEYTNALTKEINLKAKYKSINSIPIHAIFIGGGTPSVLNSDQIIKIGKSIKENFDLSHLKEFSFEMNVKTVTQDKIDALKEIGVSHARAGVQTFNQQYRNIFKLSANIDQIYSAVELLNKNFEYVCIDMLYGMNGQT